MSLEAIEKQNRAALSAHREDVIGEIRDRIVVAKMAAHQCGSPGAVLRRHEHDRLWRPGDTLDFLESVLSALEADAGGAHG